jgi:hypothetical protein
MAKDDLAETMGKLLALLKPLEAEERQRVINATLMLLGDPSPTLEVSASQSAIAPTMPRGRPQRAAVWMKQNGITQNMIDQIFHIDGDRAEVVASAVPGSSNKERTLNAYLLAGAARLLGTGDPAFDDKFARELCGNFGCYDNTNHSKYMKDRGNRLAGSASTGWKLTAPGLTQAAALVKEMAAKQYE